MKKKVFYSLLTLLVMVTVTACGKGSKTDGTFTMRCTTSKETTDALETQSVIVYNFNKDQYTTGYTITTTQNFRDVNIYNQYKASQEETQKNQTENVSYQLKSDDDAMTLEFTMTLKNLDVNADESTKDDYKASNIKKTNEGYGATCVLTGIDMKELK